MSARLYKMQAAIIEANGLGYTLEQVWAGLDMFGPTELVWVLKSISGDELVRSKDITKVVKVWDDIKKEWGA